MEDKTESFKRLLADFNDGTKDVYLQPTTAAILEQAKRNADYNLTKEDILRFRQTLSVGLERRKRNHSVANVGTYHIESG